MNQTTKSEHDLPEENTSDEVVRLEMLRKLSTAYRSKIAAENAEQKDKRNSLRWKTERDPVEYEKQKLNQKAEYAENIFANKGREVRGYVKVPGETRAKRDRNRLERDAKRKAETRANTTQAEKDHAADLKWIKRKRKAMWTEDRIAEGMEIRKADRKFYNGAYKENPLYGAF